MKKRPAECGVTQITATSVREVDEFNRGNEGEVG
jgi:hypothetical protein